MEAAGELRCRLVGRGNTQNLTRSNVMPRKKTSKQTATLTLKVVPDWSDFDSSVAAKVRPLKMKAMPDLYGDRLDQIIELLKAIKGRG
jgi:hypothetical protein